MRLSRVAVPVLSVLLLTAVATHEARAFCRGNVLTNGDFSLGLVYGSMPSASVSGWFLLSNSPQVVNTGCATPAGAVQMWGNLVVGESIKQPVSIVAGRKYRITIRYKHLNPGPSPRHEVAFRLAVAGSEPTQYPPVGGYTPILVTPPTSSLDCVTFSQDWTASANASWLTVNPENSSSINDGNEVSWGTIDDICIAEVQCGFVANAAFEEGVVYGSMPSPGALSDWSLITASPQVVSTGCSTPGGALQMWGNQVVGESVKQRLDDDFRAGKTYRITVHYKHLNPGPAPRDQVRFRLAAASTVPSAYPPLASGTELIGFTQYTSSLTCVSDQIEWTAQNDASYLTINPENESAIDDGNEVSWGTIDDICVEEIPCAVVGNGDFEDGITYGSMPSAAVAGWSLITNSPQVVSTGCATPSGAVQMWGNQVVGESIKQNLGPGFIAGRTYRITVSYKHLNPGPAPQDQVRFRLAASTTDPAAYPGGGGGGYAQIGLTPYTSSLDCVAYTFPDWTPSVDYPYLTVNPENTSSINDGAEVSWGTIDDICVETVGGPSVPKTPGADPRAIAFTSLGMALLGLWILRRRRPAASARSF